MTQHATLALAGTVGGAGTTRTTVESGAVLARAGYDVTIFDAAFGTQGLADYVRGRIDADLTAVLADDVALEAATYPIAADLPGRLAAVPAYAPFGRMARAKTAGAAERFERQIAAAALAADVVLVDTPPVAANQAVAAINACRQVALVAPDTVRGVDGLARMRGRLGDLGVGLDAIVAARSDGRPTQLQDATVSVTPSDVTEPGRCPTAGRENTPFAQSVATLVETVLGLELDVEFAEAGRLGRILPGEW